jgi:hypothetical protein
MNPLKKYWNHQIQQADSQHIYFLLILIIAMSMTFFGRYGLMPYFEWREDIQYAIEVKEKQIIRLKSLQQSSEQWKQAEKIYQQQETMNSPVFLNADTSHVAFLKFQTQLLTLIKKHHLKLKKKRFLSVVVDENNQEGIPIVLRLEGDAYNMINYLIELAEQPLIMIPTHYFMGYLPNGKMSLNFQLTAYRQL